MHGYNNKIWYTMSYIMSTILNSHQYSYQLYSIVDVHLIKGDL